MTVRLPRLTLYRKARCPLCDEALAVLDEVRARVPFELEIVDISNHPSLRDRYRMDIPVLDIEGERLFRHRIDAAQLELRLLQAQEVHNT